MVKTTTNSIWLYSKAPRVAGIGIVWRISPSRFPYCEAIGRRLRVEQNGAPGYLELDCESGEEEDGLGIRTTTHGVTITP